ncbi:hypothetical protein [Neptuniibacter marinus]|uniref:hypothetical protein n=1 Tax=Neptuniibacter marinus TaxID=1806670 RepID=UPI003B5A1C52
MSKKFSDLSARLGSSISGTEIVAIEGPAGTAYTASTISAAASDNSINDSANSLPIIPVGAAVNISGFVDASSELNGEQVVVSSNASKLVIDIDITTDESAGTSVTVQQRNKSYIMTLTELSTYVGLSAPSGTATVYDATGNSALARSNGEIQLFTLSTDTTFTISISSGESLILHLAGGGTHAPTWPALTWVDSAPAYSANDVIVFWKVGSTLYAAHVGGHA